MYRWFEKIPFFKNKLSGKILLSFSLLIFAFILFVFNVLPNRLFCFLAVLYCGMGEAVMELGLPLRVKNKNRDLVVGGILFGFAHYIYYKAYQVLIKEGEYGFFNNGALFAIITIFSLAILVLVTAKKPSIMLAFGILYLLIFGVNYVTIASYSYSAKSIAIIGAAMLLVSNMIICSEQFAGLKSKSAREALWWLYPIGQIIIIICA